VWEGTTSLRWESLGSVSLSVGQSVGRNQSVKQSVRKKEKSVFPVTGKVVISMYEERRKEAEGSINIGKCQDSRRRPIYTTTIVRVISIILNLNNYIYIYRASNILSNNFSSRLYRILVFL